MAGGNDPIKRREQARESIAVAERHLALARDHILNGHDSKAIADFTDAASALAKALRLLLEP